MSFRLNRVVLFTLLAILGPSSWAQSSEQASEDRPQWRFSSSELLCVAGYRLDRQRRFDLRHANRGIMNVRPGYLITMNNAAWDTPDVPGDTYWIEFENGERFEFHGTRMLHLLQNSITHFPPGRRAPSSISEEDAERFLANFIQNEFLKIEFAQGSSWAISLEGFGSIWDQIEAC